MRALLDRAQNPSWKSNANDAMMIEAVITEVADAISQNGSSCCSPQRKGRVRPALFYQLRFCEANSECLLK